MRMLPCLLALGCLLPGAPAPAAKPKVIVISLDGFPAYALSDPRLPIPTLRKLMSKGVTATMTGVNPSVTWPNHTAMVTGVDASRHGVLANGTITRTGAWPPVKVEPLLEQRKMVHARTIYDAAFEAGLTTAQIDWVAINNAPTITWAFSEWASASGPLEREMIAKGAVTAEELTDFPKANILYRDQMWTRAAEYLIRHHQPDLLLYHLLSLDSVHHQNGPNTLAGRAAMAFLDSCVEKVVRAVEESGTAGNTTFLIVSDHGFKAYTKQIRATNALQAAGLGDKVYVLPEGGTAFVYLADSKATAILPKVREVLGGLDGVAGVYGATDYAGLGLPTPDQDPQFGELLLAAKSGYSFSGATGGPVTAEVPQAAGSHGYLVSDPEMQCIFVAAGRGVSPGTKLERVSSLDIAPTIARLLGIQFPSAKGKAIVLR